MELSAACPVITLCDDGLAISQDLFKTQSRGVGSLLFIHIINITIFLINFLFVNVNWGVNEIIAC